MKRFLIPLLALVIAATAWAGPGKGPGGRWEGKERKARWQQLKAEDAGTTCPAGGERKHRRERARLHKPQADQPAASQESPQSTQ